MHLNCRLMFEKYALAHFVPGRSVLEIGPDKFPSVLQTLAGEKLAWHTIDLRDDPRLTYRMSDEYAFPVESDRYDLVLATNVLEHVRKPWVWIKELARVCRRGGRVITINPVSWPFHEAPHDCWRAYPEGMRALYEEAGLSVETCLFESLELPGYRRYLPGLSPDFQTRVRQRYNRIVGWFGVPVEVAFDTLTIGIKPG